MSLEAYQPELHTSETAGTIDTEVKEFSKRYTHAGRKHIADEIRELRFQYFKKQKGNSERQEQVDGEQSHIEMMQAEQQRIEAEIAELQREVTEEKSKLWFRVTSYFGKAELGQETDVAVRAEKLEEVKKGIQERLQMIGDIEGIITDDSLLSEAKKKLQDFYGEQSERKETFESERDARDVATLAKEKGYMFLHGIPTRHRPMANTSMNNSLVNVETMKPEDKLSLLMGLEPTISAAVITEKDQVYKTFYSFGVILGGGTVLSAYKEDKGTVAEGLYSRRSKYDEETTESSIQPNIEEKLDEAVASPIDSRAWGGHNEVVVENPKVAGLYINMNSLSEYDKLSVEEVRQYAQQLNLSVYALKNGELEPLDLEGEDLFESDKDSKPLGKIVDECKELEPQEKLELAESVIEKQPFPINAFDSKLVNAYTRGRGGSYSGGKKGYGEVVQGMKNYEMILATGNPDAESFNAGTPRSVLEKEVDQLVDLKNRADTADTYKSRKYFTEWVQEIVMGIHGFGEQAAEAGDMETHTLCEKIIAEFGSIQECEDMVEQRVDEQGNFKVLEKDIPFAVKQRISELKKVERSGEGKKEMYTPLPEETPEEFSTRFQRVMTDEYIENDPDIQGKSPLLKSVYYRNYRTQALRAFTNSEDMKGEFLEVLRQVEKNDDIRQSPEKDEKMLRIIGARVEGSSKESANARGAQQNEYYANTNQTREFLKSGSKRDGYSYASMMFALPEGFIDTPEGLSSLHDEVDDKVIFLFGGGESVHDLLTSEEFHPKSVINFDSYVTSEAIERNKKQIYRSEDMSATDPRIAHKVESGEIPKADEIWMSYSVPFYLDTSSEIKALIDNAVTSLAEGGNARMTPIMLQRTEIGEENFDTRKQAFLGVLEGLTASPDYNVTVFGDTIKIHKIKKKEVNKVEV